MAIWDELRPFFEDLKEYNELKAKERLEFIAKLRSALVTPRTEPESNDATAVSRGRLLNLHLESKGIKGGLSHQLWVQEHPVLNSWGNTLSSIPFIVASAPLISAVGNAAAATTVGLAITNGLNFVKNAATASKWLPWLNIGFTSATGAHGTNLILNGNITPETVLEVLPVAHFTGSNAVRIADNVKNRNLFSYKYIEPAGYQNRWKRGFRAFQHLLLDKKPDVNTITPEYVDVPDLNGYFGKELGNKLGNALAYRLRDASYRKYLGLPEKEPIYLPNDDGTWRYNLPYIEQLYKQYGLKILPTSAKVDFVTSAGGNLSSNKTIFLDKNNKYGLHIIEDDWDVNPFSRGPGMSQTGYGDRLIDEVNHLIVDKSGKLYNFLYPRLYHNRFAYNYLGGSTLNKLRVEGIQSKLLNKLSDKIANYEVGPILGGKPFTMRTEVPFTEVGVPTKIGNVEVPFILESYGHIPNEYLILPFNVLFYKKHGILNPYMDTENKAINIDNNIFKYLNLSFIDKPTSSIRIE